MTRRGGMTLVELIASLPLLAAVMALLSMVLPAVVTDVPRCRRVVETNTGICHMARALRQDIEAATALPEKFAETVSGNASLLVKLPEKVICYRADKDQVTRGEIFQADGLERTTNSWELSGAKIDFELWRDQGRPYAAVMRSAVEYAADGIVEDKLANARVYFPGNAAASGRRK